MGAEWPVALFSGVYGETDAETFIGEAARLGSDGVEIRGFTAQGLPADTPPERVAAVGAALRAHGLRLYCLYAALCGGLHA